MSPATRVSVVIPTRNRCSLLARALECVQRQRGVEVEAVVVDDGSEDGTSEYLKRVSGVELAVVRHKRPRGVATARNAGVERASASWVAFLDDDDLWAPDKLARQVAALDARAGAGLVHHGCGHAERTAGGARAAAAAGRGPAPTASRLQRRAGRRVGRARETRTSSEM